MYSECKLFNCIDVVRQCVHFDIIYSSFLEAKKSPQKRRSKELDFLVQTLGKRKRVSFGGQLSPELFDKRLPPNSPLKKGAIPARLSMPYGNSPRAALKKVADLRQSAIQVSD